MITTSCNLSPTQQSIIGTNILSFDSYQCVDVGPRISSNRVALAGRKHARCVGHYMVFREEWIGIRDVRRNEERSTNDIHNRTTRNMGEYEVLNVNG